MRTPSTCVSNEMNGKQQQHGYVHRFPSLSMDEVRPSRTPPGYTRHTVLKVGGQAPTGDSRLNGGRSLVYRKIRIMSCGQRIDWT